MKISQLQPGQRFASAALPYLTGVFVRAGAGSAVVRFDRRRTATFTDTRTGKPVTFSQLEAPVTISLETEVALEAAA